MGQNIAAHTSNTPSPVYVPYISINRQPAGGVTVIVRGDEGIQAAIWLSEDDWQAFRANVWHKGKRP